MVPTTRSSRRIGRATPERIPAAAGQGRPAAIAERGEVGGEDQLATPPGPAVEPLPLAEPGGPREPRELVVDLARLDQAGQRRASGSSFQYEP